MPFRDFKLKPSKIYIALMSCILCASLSVIAMLPIILPWRILGAVIVLAYGSHILWHYGFLRGRNAIIGIQQTPDGHWFAHSRREALAVEILNDSVVTNIIAILRFRSANRWLPTSCIVMLDSLERDIYKQLLIALRLF